MKVCVSKCTKHAWRCKLYNGDIQKGCYNKLDEVRMSESFGP